MAGDPKGFFLVAGGLFSIAGAAFDWNFFMNSGRARIFKALLGHTGTRDFYVILGLVLVGIGGAIGVGAID